MKLAPEVLAELIDIFIQGITEQVDVSNRMRGLDLKEDGVAITFTAEWLAANRKA